MRGGFCFLYYNYLWFLTHKVIVTGKEYYFVFISDALSRWFTIPVFGNGPPLETSFEDWPHSNHVLTRYQLWHRQTFGTPIQSAPILLYARLRDLLYLPTKLLPLLRARRTVIEHSIPLFRAAQCSTLTWNERCRISHHGYTSATQAHKKSTEAVNYQDEKWYNSLLFFLLFCTLFVGLILLCRTVRTCSNASST